MMYRITQFVLLLLLLLLAACATSSESTANNVSTASTAVSSTANALPPVLPNLLLQVTGQVEVRREGSTGFVPVALGAAVEPGDTLRLVEGEAAIFCGNEALWDDSPQSLSVDEEKGVPCQEGRPPRPAPDLSGLRAGRLYALSPRSGFVMDERPTLRWNRVSNVQEYAVTLKSDDGKERPPVTVSDNELAYPAEWDALQAGATYRLQIEIEIDGVKSESNPEGEFLLLSAEKRQQLEAQVERLQQSPLHDLSRTLLLAELHLNYELYSEAIELLLKADGDQVAVQRLLGETYLEMGLLDEATAAYSQALALAEAAELPEEQAAAHLRLGFAACLQADEEQARSHKQEAQKLYEQMETPMDEALLAELDEKCSN